MLYAIYGKDVADSLPIRRRVRAEHLERVKRLADEGRLVIAGPLPAIDSPDPGPAGFHGSLIVAEFESLEDAEQWIAGDPYASEGVFESVHVKPFRRVLP